jgi:hypothetical protein
MKAGLHNKKVFHHDIVALALACVISLLFTNRVAEFFHYVSKKQDHYRSSVTFSVHNDSYDEETMMNVQLPVEDLNVHFKQYAIAPSATRLQRLAAVFTNAKKEGRISRSADRRFEQHPNYILPVGWSTPISIAQRKLII